MRHIYAEFCLKGTGAEGELMSTTVVVKLQDNPALGGLQCPFPHIPAEWLRSLTTSVSYLINNDSQSSRGRCLAIASCPPSTRPSTSSVLLHSSQQPYEGNLLPFYFADGIERHRELNIYPALLVTGRANTQTQMVSHQSPVLTTEYTTSPNIPLCPSLPQP